MRILMSKAAKKNWGENSDLTFTEVSQKLAVRGFSGPLSWKDKNSISYVKDVCETIRVVLSFSRGGGGERFVNFDCPLIILSKTVYENQESYDPWISTPMETEPFKGYVPCMTVRLSHFKWAENFGSEYSSWTMTTEPEFIENIYKFFVDFDKFFKPFVIDLTSDLKLYEAISYAETHTPPEWVKSDSVLFFTGIQQKKEALMRGINANNAKKRLII